MATVSCNGSVGPSSHSPQPMIKPPQSTSLDPLSLSSHQVDTNQGNEQEQGASSSSSNRSTASTASATASSTTATMRLDFNSIEHQHACGENGCCGGGSRGGIRQHELQILMNYATSTSKKPAIWIEAEAGVGKSWLVQQFRDELLNQTEGSSSAAAAKKKKKKKKALALTIFGKFEERTAASEPFAALREAVAELVDYVMTNLDDKTREGWADDIQELLGMDLPLLLSIMPALRQVFERTTNGHGQRQQRSGSAVSTQSSGATSFDSEEKDDFDTCEDAFGDFNSKEYRFERFRLAFRGMIRYVCSQLQKKHKQPLVLILDDFHWVDPDSLQIVKTLMEDTRKPTNFLLVAATRPLDGFSHLMDFHRSMTIPPPPSTLLSQESTGSKGSKFFSIASNRNSFSDDDAKLRIMGIPRLSVKEIGDMLKTLLKKDQTRDDPSITEFAEVVKSKTQGNSFVVLQFLRLLERSGHIWYDDKEASWKFNLSQVMLVDRISENVSEVVAHNMEASVTKRRRSALMVAASFGVSQFEVSTIVHAVSVLDQQAVSSSGSDDDDDHTSPALLDAEGHEEHEDPYVVRQRIQEMSCELTLAQKEGYVEETSPGHFRFAHDRIRESAYSLLPEGNSRKQVHLRVGRQLRSWMDTQSELGLGASGFSKDSLLLHATKQLNAGASLIDDEWELLDLVDLNYQAAELAAKKTAFYAAMEYLQVGLKHLGGEEKAWSRKYDRALKFSVALTRMQYSCGLLEECWDTSEIVIRHGKNMRDKSRIYHTRILCLRQNEMMDEALDHVLEVFELMEQPIPRRFVMFHVGKEYMKARKFLKSKTDEELLNLPSVYDEDLEIYVDFLQSLGEICFLHGKLEYLIFVSLRLLNLVAEYGNYPRSCFAYQLHACFFKPQMGDLVGSLHYATIANALAKKQKNTSPGSAARSDEMYYAYVQHWQYDQTLKEAVPNDLDAYQRLWSAGLVDTALMDASTMLQHLFCAGEPIERVIKECDRYSEAFKDYQQMGHWYINASEYQALLNFQGHSERPSILTGALMDADACKDSWKVKPNPPALYNYQFWSMVVGYHFGDYLAAKQNIKAMRADIFEDGFCHLVPLRPFYTALVYLALFRSTRKSKYRGRAMKSLKILHGWLATGANFEFMCKLIEAEDVSSRAQGGGSTSDVVEIAMAAYDRSIDLVSKSDQTHHMALCNELAGAFLASQNESTRATQYLNNAVKLYQEWGAFAKVKDIRSRYKDLVTSR